MPNQITVESGQLTPTQQYEKLIGMGMSPSDASQYAGFTPFQTDTPSKDEMRLAVARNRAGQPVQGTPLETFTGAMQGLGNMLGSAAVGTGASILGTPGNIESLGRQAINYVSPNTVSPQTNMPTSEDILNKAKQVPILQDYADNVATKLGENVVGGILDPYTMVKGVKATKSMPVGMSTQDVSGIHPKVKAGIERGDIHPDDARWMSDYAHTEGNPQVETGSGAYADQSEKMQNFIGRMERGEIPIPEHLKNKIKVGGNSSGLNPKGATLAKPQAFSPKDDFGFYSKLEKESQNLQRKQGNGQAFMNDLMKLGVKPHEFEATGMSEFLKNNNKLTKDDVVGFAQNNRPKMEETILSKTSDYPYKTPDAWQNAINNAERRRDFDEAERLTHAWEEYEGLGGNKTPEHEHHFRTPGGENYRELLIKSPNNKLSDTPFKERNHFPYDENILAFMRMDDRIDVDGKKGTLLDELQSDWHQQGKEKGYSDNARKQKIAQQIKDLGINKNIEDVNLLDLEKHGASKELEKDFHDNYLQKALQVPDVPYKNNWHELGLKKAIQHAVERGDDRLYLPTGDTLADRYDLSKQISNIKYKPLNDPLYKNNLDEPYFQVSAKDIHGNEVFQKQLAQSELSDHVGKDLAKKIIANEGVPHPYLDDVKQFEGLDLKVGGEGMRKYYDEIYPSYLKKFAKQYGGHVGETNIDIGHNMPISKKLEILGMSENDFNNLSKKEYEALYDKPMTQKVYYYEPSKEAITKIKGGLPYKDGGAVKFANGGSVMETEIAKIKEILAKKKIEDELSGMAKRSEELRAYRPYESLTEVKPVTQEQVNAEYQVRQSKPTVGLRPTDVGGSKIPSTQLELFKKKGGVISFDEMRLALARKR